MRSLGYIFLFLAIGILLAIGLNIGTGLSLNISLVLGGVFATLGYLMVEPRPQVRKAESTIMRLKRGSWA